jgi:transposase InsO family protein
MLDYNVRIKDVEKLKEGAWLQWSKDMEFAFMEAGFMGFIDGSVGEPTETKKLAEWQQINSRIVGTLGKHVDNTLRRLLTPTMTAKDAWDALKREAHQAGMITKISAITSAMNTKFSDPRNTARTISEIEDFISDIYEGGTAPTQADFTILVLMNALQNTQLDWVRKHLLAAFSSTAAPPSKRDVIETINLGGREKTHLDKANVAKTDQRQKVKCTNCSKNHPIERCWKKGGGAEDKAPDWFKEAEKKRSESRKKKKAEKSNVATDSSGSESDTANLAIDLESSLAAISRLNDGYYSCAAIEEALDSSSAPPDDKAHPVTELMPWCADSGCTTHVSPVRSDFTDLVPINRRVRGVGGQCLAATGSGTIHVRCGKGRKLILRNALYVPEATLRLMSIVRLDNDGFQATFGDSRVAIKNRSGKVMAEGAKVGTDLYYISGNPKAGSESAHIARAAPDLETWHKRLGHLNYSSIIKMAKSGMAAGMPVDLSTLPPLCEHCVIGKQTKTPVPKARQGEKAKRRLEKVFSDITGPEDVGSMSGDRYVLNFIDDSTSMSWLFPLKKKSDAVAAFKEWIALVERESNEKVRIFRTDNGGEYTSDDFETYLKHEGIRHETTAPYTSAENGRAERCHRTIMNRARAIRSDAKLPPSLWAESVRAAAYLKNRTHTRTLQDKTPYEMWFGVRPDITHLRELGCRAWVHITGENPKIYNRSIECVLIGYSETSKAYRCLDRSTGKIHVTRNVVFAESQDSRPRNLHPGVVINKDTPQEPPPETWSDLQGSMQNDTDPGDSDHDMQSDPAAKVLPRRSARVPKMSAAGAAMRGLSYESVMDKTLREMHESKVQSRGGAPLDNEEVGVFVAKSEEEWCYVGEMDDPRTYREILQRSDAPQWEKSMTEEMNSLAKHGVWQLVPRTEIPDGRRVIPSKWVFLRKRDETGSPKRFKSRVVAKGFVQRAGIDYTDTFAPVTRMESVRAILHIGAAMDWEIHQMDIKTAFLHGELKEEVYMEQPEGRIEKGKETYVCRLNKTLYGLVQSPRMWNARLNKALVDEIGFTRIAADHCVYVRTTKDGTSIIGIHVDDICATASTATEMKRVKGDIGAIFDLVDLGEVHHLLGMAIRRDRETRTITLSQRAYIETITKRLNLQDAYAKYTPLDHTVALTKDLCPSSEEEKEEMKKVPYLTAIGSMMYAAMGTRPDISFAVSHLSQFSANPGPAHWTQAQRVITYLYTTRDVELVLGGKEISLSGWVDSDWASDRDDRRSIAGYMYSLGGGPISWSSKKQPTVATSSVEAEYMACAYGIKEALWLRSLLKLMDFEQKTATSILCDNMGAIILTKDPTFHARTKHIDVAHHFIRERHCRHRNVFWLRKS